ncbi:pre-peptidase C-terminal domain-containing protein [Nodosilinea nodulosa]|uniref:pre-peptidase C-terminal domain-containing protein n=1 Tax=Nodosilinea nodulosa TaxID=416001 RepID=UPI0002EC4F08|nr:pre-peptidase C-terminal domain-containing protein [Nodosilinea nodulosa]
MELKTWIGPSAVCGQRRVASRVSHALQMALGIILAAAASAQAQSTATLQSSLQLAVCLNDWDSAIARTEQLEAVPGLPIKTQAQLVLFRRQMQLFRQNQTAVSNISGCEPVLAGFGLPGYTGRPLQLERAAFSSGSLDSSVFPPDQATRQIEALWQAGLGVSADTTLDPLAEAQRINTRSGSGVSTGAVSRRVDVYAFLGAEGDTPNLALDVIQQRRGLLYTDDSSLLFLFDAQGRLLGEARPTPASQPRIESVTLPATGVYYAAVTTPQHRPVLNEDGLITDWQGIGTSAVTYTLTLRGLTPSPELGLGSR